MQTPLGNRLWSLCSGNSVIACSVSMCRVYVSICKAHVLVDMASFCFSHRMYLSHLKRDYLAELKSIRDRSSNSVDTSKVEHTIEE